VKENQEVSMYLQYTLIFEEDKIDIACEITVYVELGSLHELNENEVKQEFS
jgi:hypothetical protein